MRFHFSAGLRHRFIHGIQNMQPALASLFQCLAHDFHAQSIYLNIHLDSANAFTCSGYFKIHIAEMIFITKNICKNGIFSVSARVIKPIATPPTCLGREHLHPLKPVNLHKP